MLGAGQTLALANFASRGLEFGWKVSFDLMRNSALLVDQVFTWGQSRVCHRIGYLQQPEITRSGRPDFLVERLQWNSWRRARRIPDHAESRRWNVNGRSSVHL